MLVSMTGYGRSALNRKDLRVEWSIKGVNHRFLEVNLRMPEGLEEIEEEIQQKMRAACKRGRIDVTLRVAPVKAAPSVHLDSTLARQYVTRLRKMAKGLGIEGDVRLENLINLPGVIRSAASNPDGLRDAQPVLREGFQRALDDFLGLRRREGQTLEKDFMKQLQSLEEGIKKIEARIEEETALRSERLKKRLVELGAEDAESKRFQNELAYILERMDVTEEITRLKSHLVQFKRIMTKESEAGRKLDFLLQEMHREITTLSAKCESPDWIPVALSLKAAAEKMRQQVQNIE